MFVGISYFSQETMNNLLITEFFYGKYLLKSVLKKFIFINVKELLWSHSASLQGWRFESRQNEKIRQGLVRAPKLAAALEIHNIF